ncbi:MAG: efflux transporter outer membrane subunit [Desulfobacterales bacterium]
MKIPKKMAVDHKMAVRTGQKLLRVLGLIGMLLLGGCPAVGPDYIKPDTVPPSAWYDKLQDGLTDTTIDPRILAQWWTTLEDPALSGLMERAVSGNLDLKNASARVREARALRNIRRSAFFPAIDATGSVYEYQNSENGIGGGTEGELYSAGFDANWELDVFGGLRRAVEAAQRDLEASWENLNDVLVSLLAEVALNYTDVRTYQARLAVAAANIAAQEETFKFTSSRFDAGLSDELAVQQALTNLETTRSQIPSLKTGLIAANNRLSVLLGTLPGAVNRELAESRPIPVPPVSVAVGVPADTLRHRPDVRRTERLLAAQTARIGVATADLYPKFFLTGTIGLESISAGDLFDSASQVWRIGPSVSWKLFDAGATRQRIEFQNALRDQVLNEYNATILQALEEVENALVAYAQEQFRRESLKAAVAAAQRAVLLAQDQYIAGLVDFNNVLIAQRSLLSLQDELALSEGQVTSNLVRLYKALGGGWTSQGLPAEEMAAGG